MSFILYLAFIEDVLSSDFELQELDVHEGISHRPLLPYYQAQNMVMARTASEQGYKWVKER